MKKFKDINSAIEELKNISESMNKTNEIVVEDKSYKVEEKRLNSLGEELEDYISLINKWLKVKILSKNDAINLQNGYLVYNGKRPNSLEYNENDFLEVIEEGQQLLESLTDEFAKNPFLPEGKKVIFNFMYVFNTLVEISENFSMLVAKRIRILKNESLESLKNEKLKLEKKNAEFKNSLKEIKDYLNEKIKSNKSMDKVAKLSFGNGYKDKVFLGYSMSKSINEETCKLANDLLNIDISDLATKTPLYYEINQTMNPIVIDCKSDDIKEANYLTFLENLCLYLLCSVPAKKIRFAGIECDANNDGFLYTIVDSLEKIFYDDKTKSNIHEVIYGLEESKIAENDLDVKELLGNLNNLIRNRKRRYSNFSRTVYQNANSHNNFFDYNAKTIDNQDELIVLIVNNYPKGFEDESTIKLLKNVLEAAPYGFVSIILQDKNPNLYVKTESFIDTNYVKLPIGNALANIICDIDNDGCILTYNGKHVSFDGNIYNLSSSELSSSLTKKIKSFAAFNTMDLIKKTEDVHYPSLEKALNIPLGLSGDSVFDFSTSIGRSPHAIVLGGTGSGKTALLHTLILNAAATYSPEEIEFYLSDFKSAKGSGAFGGFLKGKEMAIPHVKYLSLKSNPENTSDMIDMITQMHNDRMELISKCGFEDIHEYNNSKIVLDGNKDYPRLSRLCFIIDEYAEMLIGGKKSDVLSKLSRLLKLVRTSGIFIVLCGQSDSELSEDEIKQLDTRILLKSYQVSNTKEFIKGGNDSIQDINSFATIAGKGCVSLDGGNNYSNVNFAFSGGVGSQLIKSICKYINDKYKGYKYDQIVAGDESIVDISLDERIPELINKKISEGYNLYIGQSSISYNPVAVRYFTSQKDNNYFLTGEKEMVDRVKQNMILSFIQNTIAAKSVYDSYRVYDCWFKIGQEKNGNCLEEFINEYPILNKYVKHIEDKYEIGITIKDIYEKHQNGEITEPILLLVHGASAIPMGKYFNNGVKEKEVVVKEKEEIDISKYVELVRSQLAENNLEYSEEDILLFAQQYAEADQTEEVVEDETTEVYDEISTDLVRNYIKELYRLGNLYNVFVLLDEGTYEYVEPYIKGNDRAVLSCISDRSAPTEYTDVTEYPTSCCHVKSNQYSIEENESASGKIVRSTVRQEVDLKVKLFDYSLANNKSWWKNFVKLLK